MMRATVWLCVVLLAGSLVACYNTVLKDRFLPSPRTVGIGFSYSELEHSAPVALHVQIYADPSTADMGVAPAPLTKLVEVNFGTGGGWEGITPQQPEESSAAVKPVYLADHTYMEGGSYEIQARATYYDDEVVCSKSRTVTVMAAVE